MSKRYIEPSQDGEVAKERAATGARHVFVARRLEIERRYHDDSPLQDAEFTLTSSDGFEFKGKLDKAGKATVVGAPASGSVRFGPDARKYSVADDRENPDKRDELTDSDFEAMYAKYRR